MPTQHTVTPATNYADRLRALNEDAHALVRAGLAEGMDMASLADEKMIARIADQLVDDLAPVQPPVAS